MSIKTPAEISQAALAAGIAKSRLALGTMQLMGFLAGAYIGMGGYFMLVVTQDAAQFAGVGISKLLGGVVFSLGLFLVLTAGADVLFLDEMTDNLDVESERALVDALAPLTRGRATWIIAHRLQTLRQVDRIVVMRHGRITASGSYEEIVDDAGHFLEATGREAASYV